MQSITQRLDAQDKIIARLETAIFGSTVSTDGTTRVKRTRRAASAHVPQAIKDKVLALSVGETGRYSHADVQTDSFYQTVWALGTAHKMKFSTSRGRGEWIVTRKW